ncbi:MAG TPA: type II secretion system protein M [Steroidobacteraceae bacterium]|nr:type II secretion system protein M [Steroidobacteraceae bacterium]
MREWLRSLNARERLFVIGGGVLVLLVAVYTLVLGPFYNSIDRRAERVADKTADLAWMQSVAGEMQTLAASGASGQVEGSGESLVVIVDRTSREAGLGGKVTGQTPTGEAGIRVRLEQAPFDVIVAWLATLEQRYGIAIESASIDRSAQLGLVNASIVLTRAGA